MNRQATNQASSKDNTNPYSYLEDSHHYGTRDALQKCTQPKLFIAGTYDTQVPLELARKTFELAPEPKHFVQVPSYHGYRYSKRGVEEVDKLIRTFASNLEDFS